MQILLKSLQNNQYYKNKKITRVPRVKQETNSKRQRQREQQITMNLHSIENLLHLKKALIPIITNMILKDIIKTRIQRFMRFGKCLCPRLQWGTVAILLIVFKRLQT